MSKLTLTNLVNLQNETTAVNAINGNSTAIITAFDNTLSRDGTSPNTMGHDFDMNGFRILNLPDPIGDLEPVNLRTFNTGIAGTGNVPAGGTTGQSLVKTSNLSFATGWGTPTINLTGPITSIGPATSIGAQTGAGQIFVMSVSPTITGHPTIEGVTSTGATGTGNLVFATAPTLGAVTATSINKVNITAPASSSTLTIPDGVTLTGPASSGTAMTLGNNETVTGVKTFGAAGNVGKLSVAGTTSGTTVINASATASGTLTLPAATDTLIGKATTDTLTNKTFNSSGTGNVLQVSGVTVSSGQYPGEPTTGSATAGNVGEYVSTSVAVGSAIALTGGVTANVMSISLTAGDWDVQAMTRFTGGATTTVARVQSSISTTSGALGTSPGSLTDWTFNVTTPFATIDPTFGIPPIRISVSGVTTVFLTVNAGFGTSTMAAYGFLSARRAR